MADDSRKMAQGIAKPATPEDIEKEATGFTNPNLHRRVVDPEDRTSDKEYELSVYGVNTILTVFESFHDEDSTTCEIP